MSNNQPQFPLYVVSKGRADSRMTVKALDRLNTPFYIVIEEQEYAAYSAVIPAERILVLDKLYQRTYDTFDALDDTKSKGPGPARNFAWAHALAQGHAWHWVMDDNIRGFHRLNRNMRIPLGDGSGFKAMEGFCLRYTNIGMAGPNYWMFAPRKTRQPPFIANTRIYSCNLIRNDTPFRWRGRYNEDTDLSLRLLKAAWCTVQFNAFLQDKMQTQLIKGGNTAEFYAKEGTSPKSQMLKMMHPDVTTLVWKFQRHHHHVDYRPFKALKLIRDESVEVGAGVNDYGMTLKQKALTPAQVSRHRGTVARINAFVDAATELRMTEAPSAWTDMEKPE